MMMMMMMMMMIMCKRLAQVPMLCVPIYNMKLAMMQKTLIFTTFSAHMKMAADKRGQIKVFARIFIIKTYDIIYIYINPQFDGNIVGIYCTISATFSNTIWGQMGPNLCLFVGDNDGMGLEWLTGWSPGMCCSLVANPW